MARSTYVYVLFDASGMIRGCFTVKREALDYQRCFGRNDWKLLRYHDGGDEVATVVPLAD